MKVSSITHQTLKNPRWWAALPVLLPLAALVLGMAAFHKPIWWLGQAICGLSNAVSPFNYQAPKVMQGLHRWIQAGVRREEGL